MTPEETDEYYARLPFPEAQRIFAAGSPQLSEALVSRIGWHGTATDLERGSFAIVREDGPLAHLIGERLRITRGDRVGRLQVYVYCHSRLELPDDLSVPRRIYLQLGLPAEDDIPVTVEIV